MERKAWFCLGLQSAATNRTNFIPGAPARASSRARQGEPASEGVAAPDGDVAERQGEDLQGADQRPGGTGRRLEGPAVERNEETANPHSRY